MTLRIIVLNEISQTPLWYNSTYKLTLLTLGNATQGQPTHTPTPSTLVLGVSPTIRPRQELKESKKCILLTSPFTHFFPAAYSSLLIAGITL